MIRVLVRSKGEHRALMLYYLDPRTGREVSKSAETNDRKKAERAAAVWEAELRQWHGVNDDGWEYFRERFADEHLATLSRHGRLAYGTALNHLERLSDPVAVSDVTASMLSVFKAALIKEERPLSSIASYLTHIRGALNWARSVGIIREAPTVGMPRTGKRKFMRGRPLTLPEFRLLLATCRKLHEADAEPWCRFLELIWFSGMRLAEAMKCSWSMPPVQVNLEADPYPQIIFLVEGHKSREDDAIPMCPDLADWLSRTPPKERVGLVAPVPLESESRVSEFLCEIGKEAKIVVNEEGKFASAHDLRRAFGTRWAAQVRPLTLQRLMRHKRIETTLKYYVGLTSADAGDELWGVPKNVPKTG